MKDSKRSITKRGRSLVAPAIVFASWRDAVIPVGIQGEDGLSSSCVEATFLESETCVIDDGIENFFGEGYCVISGRGKIRRID